MRLVAVTCSLLAVGWASVAAAESDTAAASSGHEEALARVQHAQASALGVELERYDRHLAAHPDDGAALVERCRLLLGLLDDEGEDEVGAEALYEDCLERLDRDFAEHPQAVLFRVELAWGEEAEELAQKALDSKTLSFTHAERGSLFETLAWQRNQRDVASAAVAARAALAYAPELDLTLILAEHERQKGERAEAVRLLASRIEGTPPWQLVNKAHALADLAAFDTCHDVIERMQANDVYVDPLLHARVLKALGRSDEARAAYREASTSQYRRNEVLLELFRLELEGDDPEAMAASYQALRDEGFESDPFGRHRLSLFFASPTSSPRARDVGGLLGLLALLLAAAAAPALFIVPIHYLGMFRRARAGAPLPPSDEPWRLRRAFLACSLVFVCDFVVLYLFAYDELAFLFELVGEDPRHPIDVLAAVALASTLTGTLIALLVARRADLKSLLGCDWSFTKTVGIVLVYDLVIWFVLVVCHSLASAFELVSSFTDSIGFSVGSFTTAEMLRALAQHHGIAALLVVVVVLTPFYEELLARGVLLNGFARHLPLGWANAGQATLFALAHDNWSFFPVFFVFGMLAGRLRRLSGGLRAPMMMHAVHNLIASIAIVISLSMS